MFNISHELYNQLTSKSKLAWKRIVPNKKPTGHIAYYYSDDDASLPIRAVRKKNDNKSDPNIETKSYGMFSTCMPPARKNMVKRNDSYIFFFTKWMGKRMFTGYYELSSYLNTGITPIRGGKESNFSDYALLAKHTHFIKNGIPLTGKKWSKIVLDKIKNKEIKGYGPRDFSKIDSAITMKLKKILDRHSNITKEYVREIKKMEKENFVNDKMCYPTWGRKTGFTKTNFRDFVKW